MLGKEKDLLRQFQELLCLRKLAVNSDPRSEPERVKRPFFWSLER